MSAATTMKSAAAEYFASLSPVKDDGSKSNKGGVGRGGRCHCCPYGYHIDLDFVRYCHTLAKGCEQESATLRKLKQSKRQRRRETHSMEVMLGLTAQQQLQQNGTAAGDGPIQEGSSQAPTPPPRRNSLKHLHKHLTTTTTSTSCSITTNGGLPSPPPDVVRMANNSSSVNNNNSLNRSSGGVQPSCSLSSQLVGAQRSSSQSSHAGRAATFTQASDAFQEAMQDFEDTLESSHDTNGGGCGPCTPRSPRVRSSSTSNVPPSLDLLQHHNNNNNNNSSNSGAQRGAGPQRKIGVGAGERSRGSGAPSGGGAGPPVSGGVGTAMASMLAQSAVNRVRSASVTRSNSLPRYFPDESPHAAWFSRVRPSNNNNNTPYSPHPAGGASAGGSSGQGGQPPYGGGGGGLSLREALASLEAAKGGGGSMRGGGVCSPPPMPDDVMSVTSAASQLSTSTLQSIRDQMATGLSRLRELEAEVRNIPHLQRELETLRVERQQLQRQVEAARTGADDRSEDDSSLTRDLLSASGRARRRSQSPVRVNLEEFCSYRRARAGSVSDCSDSESVTSERRYRATNRTPSSNYHSTYTTSTTTDVNNINVVHKNSLFITEGGDQQQQLRGLGPEGRRAAIEGKGSGPSLAGRADYSSRVNRRDASTSCRVLTRDVGIHHAARTRSVGLMADLLPPPPAVAPAPPPDARDSRSPQRELKRPSLPNLFTVSRATQTVEDRVDAKSKLLSQLGRQNSGIISRLSEVQKEAPALMFDNSTNTELRPQRTQAVNTDPQRTRDQKNNTVLAADQVVSRDDMDAEVNERVKLRLKEQLERAKKTWEVDVEDTLQERLLSEMEKVEEKYRQQFEKEVTERVSEKLRSEMTKAKLSFEDDINEEVQSRVSSELATARQLWEAAAARQNKNTAPSKPMMRERSVQAVIPLPEPAKPEKIYIEPVKPSVRTVAAGEGRLTDLLCDKCCVPKKSVGCSWDRVTDVVCDTCKDRKQALSLKPATRSSSMQTAPPLTKPTSSNSSQTAAVSLRTSSTNTTFLALKKEDALATAASPAVTPELERRPFGSSGVRVCDKCHDTITSVAKDIVGTSSTSTGGSAALATGPPVIIPLPPSSVSSKIPRLVDPFKPEQRLEGEEGLGGSGGSQGLRRDSELRRSDSRLDQLSSTSTMTTSATGAVELGRRSDQTPDLLSDSNIVREARRNSGPDADKQKVPFNRQHTYTKLTDGGGAGSTDFEEGSLLLKTARKMSTFEEEDESAVGDTSAPSSRKQSSSSSLFRRERSSPEIGSGGWKRKTDAPQPGAASSKVEGARRDSAAGGGETASVADAWQREMTSYSSKEEDARASRSTSVDSTATYKVEDTSRNSLRRSPTPPSPQKGPASPSPPRKATPIPAKVAPPPNFKAPPPTTATPTSTPSSSKQAIVPKPSLLVAKPSIPTIVRTSPPPPQQQQQQQQPTLQQQQLQKSPAPSSQQTAQQQTVDPAAAPTAEAASMRLSTTSVDDLELLDSGDESIVASSIVTQDSSVYGPAGSPQQQRKKPKLGRNLRAALKVLNDSIGKPVRSGQQLTNALNIIQRDWFKYSSQPDSNPHLVEDYLDIFEMQYSRGLLHRVVNLADVNGNTAMHYAVSQGNYDVVSVLLDSKVCSVNQQNKAGYTATMLVSLAPIKCSTHASVVERLFSMSDVNVKADQHGQTALMLAVSHGRLDTVRLLLAAGADVNIQDDDGSTALMCAAEHGHLAIVRYLLQCPDTDAHLVDNDGSSALAIAVEAGHKDVGVLLYKHMNLARNSSPYSSLKGKRSRTPTLPRSTINTPPPRFSAPPSPGRSRRGSGPPSPPSSHHNSPHTARHKHSSASLSNLNF